MYAAIVHVDVSGQHGVVGHNHVIAQLAIVGHVDADHQQAMVADGGGVVGYQRAVNGDVLADGVARADHHPARLDGRVDVLGQPAENDAVEQVVVGAQGCPCLTTTRLSSTQPGPIATSGSTMQKGPIWTSGPIWAEELTMAVG